MFYIQVCILHSSFHFIRLLVFYIQVCILFKFGFYPVYYSIAILFRGRKFSGDLVKMEEGNRSTTRSTPNLAEVARLYCCTDNVMHMQCSVLMYAFHSPISVE